MASDLEMLATIQDFVQAHAAGQNALLELLRYSPARLSVETLSTSEPIRSGAELGDAQSVGVLNWSTVAVQVGFAGRSATEGNGFPVPPRSWVVLPIECNLIDLGADPLDLAAAGDAMVGLIRFDAPQPLMAGSLGGEPLALGESVGDDGADGDPGARAVIASVDVPPGVYRVRTLTWQEGTFDGQVLNMRLVGRNDIVALPSDDRPAPTVIDQAIASSAQRSFQVVADAPSGVGAIYVAQLVVTRLA